MTPEKWPGIDPRKSMPHFSNGPQGTGAEHAVSAELATLPNQG
ncbi:MAG: hypothetical protein WCP41_06710 [Verrucomicrobiota bacterium]